MYRPCYAPVFPASSAVDCALQNIRLAILLVFLILILIVTFGSEGILCLIRKTQFRMRHCREGNDDPRIDLGFTLDRWIERTPRIRNAIIWRPDATRVLAYHDWDRADKDRLADVYERLRTESDAGLAEDPPIMGFRYFDRGRGERDNPVVVTGYSLEVARQTFFAQVAQSLLLEIEERVPWRLAALSDEHLAFLFDSLNTYLWNDDLDRHSLNLFLGLATPGDPGRIYSWLMHSDITRATPRETIIALLEWCRNLFHDAGILDASGVPDWYPGGRNGNLAHWQYEGLPPVERTLNGTRRADSPRLLNWTHGCQGTTGMLRSVLRAVNIPVKREDGCNHAIPHFLVEGEFLSHGDDPYGRYMKQSPSQVPMAEILLSTDLLDGFFDDCREDHSRVGWGVSDALARLLPDPILQMRCRDLANGHGRTGGEVFALFDRHFTEAELLDRELWARLDAAIEARGGCSVILGPD